MTPLAYSYRNRLSIRKLGSYENEALCLFVSIWAFSHRILLEMPYRVKGQKSQDRKNPRSVYLLRMAPQKSKGIPVRKVDGYGFKMRVVFSGLS
jgi:hypothetical protein